MRDVGIVMPVYNQVPSYLRLALRSILRQTYRHYHFVIVIDGANKNTQRIIQQEVRHDPRVKILINPRNMGVSKSLNRGFQQLMKLNQVKYLTWVSSDNYYYPNFIHRLRSVLHNGPDRIGLVYSSFRFIDRNGKVLYDANYYRNFRQWQRKSKADLLDICFVGAAFMYKKKYAAKIGGYYMEPVEDYDYWLRLTEVCDLKYVPIPLMDYRSDSPKSISQTLKSPGKHRRWRHAFQLTKYRARARQGVPLETTVIFPFRDASKETMQSFESVLEGHYSNYRMMALDLSPGAKASQILRKIPDPRLEWYSLPNIGEKVAIRWALQRVQTPYTALFRKDAPSESHYHLENMVSQMRGTPPDIISCFSNPNPSRIGTRRNPTANDPLFGHLYRTKWLRELVK
jgi:GT2 family glycosyltransferase